jgi:hypothetical protein
VPLTTSTGLAVKRLVIEDVGMNCFLDPVAPSAVGLITVPFPADSVAQSQAALLYPITTTLFAPGSALGHSSVRIYADPGAELRAFVAVGGNAAGDCIVSLSGHLETK